MITGPTALQRIGGFVAGFPLTISRVASRMARDGIMDVFGCILGGAGTAVARSAADAVRSMGADRGQSRVYGASFLAPNHTAAMLNGISGHALEFDDWEILGNTHPSTVLLPALLSVADRDTTGAELLTAYAVGFEVIARLGEGMNFEHYDAGWHSTATLGALGSTAAVSSIRKLDEFQVANAISIAVSRAAGLTCQFGADTKAMQAGFAAETGVVSVELAAAGITGRMEALDHPRGMAALMAGVNRERIHAALDRFGVPPALDQYGILLKPWPSCGYTHRIMNCARELATTGIDPDDIESIDLHLPDFHAAILPYQHPRDRREALFSLPFVSAMGLMHGNLTLEDLDTERWNDPGIRRLIDSSTVHPFRPSRPELNYDPNEPDRLRINFKGGANREAICALPPGSPENPLSFEDVLGKFRRNAGIGTSCSLEAMETWPDSPSVLSVFESLDSMTERR